MVNTNSTVRGLLSFLRPYFGKLVPILAVDTLVTVAGLLMPLFVRYVIDQGMKGDDSTILLRSGAIVMAIGLAMGLLAIWVRIARARVSVLVTQEIREKLVQHLFRLPFAFHDRSSSAKLVTLVTSDVNTIRAVAGGGVLTAIGNMILIVLGWGVLLYLDPILTIASAWPFLFIYFTADRVGRIMEGITSGVQGQIAQLAAALYETIGGVHTTRALSREKDQAAKVQGDVNTLMSRRLQTTRNQAFYHGFMAVIASLPSAIILAFGAYRVLSGQLSVGTWAAFVGYMMFLHMPMHHITMALEMLHTASACGERIMDVLAEAPLPETGDITPPAKAVGEIELQRVAFDYKKGAPVLRDVSLHIRPGQRVAIVGPSGAGKSTLVNLMARLYDCTSGTIYLDGVDVSKYSLNWLRNQIGILSQDCAIFSGTLRENIRYGRPDATDSEVDAVVQATGLLTLARSLPQGLDSSVGERGMTLSAGERQRLGLARVLLRNPSVIVLDDFTSNLDATTEADIVERLKEVTAGRTLVIVSQRAKPVQLAERIIRIENGRVHQDGDVQSILASPDPFWAAFGLQSGPDALTIAN